MMGVVGLPNLAIAASRNSPVAFDSQPRCAPQPAQRKLARCGPELEPQTTFTAPQVTHGTSTERSSRIMRPLSGVVMRGPRFKAPFALRQIAELVALPNLQSPVAGFEHDGIVIEFADQLNKLRKHQRDLRGALALGRDRVLGCARLLRQTEPQRFAIRP
jgi:hypothetical protein